MDTDQGGCFFIIGNPRSGTTLLRLMLTCHPNIVVPPEGGFCIKLFAKYNSFGGDIAEIESFVDDLLKIPKMEFWGLSRKPLIKYIERIGPTNYNEMTKGVYRYYGKSKTKKDFIWGDKNNFYLNHIEKIAMLFPDAVFLHIVRDGRDVACSYRDLSTVKGKYAPLFSNSVMETAIEWKTNLLTIRKSFDSIGWHRVCEIKYEDLIIKPRNTLNEICLFLGKEYSDEMLEYHERNKNDEIEPTAYNKWKALTKEKLTDSRIERWRSKMFYEDIIIFQNVSSNMLQQYSYPLSVQHQYRLNIFLKLHSAFYILSRKKWLPLGKIISMIKQIFAFRSHKYGTKY